MHDYSDETSETSNAPSEECSVHTPILDLVVTITGALFTIVITASVFMAINYFFFT